MFFEISYDSTQMTINYINFARLKSSLSQLYTGTTTTIHIGVLVREYKLPKALVPSTLHTSRLCSMATSRREKAIHLDEGD
jgi:hypothetical protein